MLDEPFSRGASRLHLADPRCKLAAALAFAVCVAPLRTPALAAVALALGAALCLWARLPLPRLLRRLAAVNVFVALLWLFLPFSLPGAPLLRIGPFPGLPDWLALAATDAGVTLAVLVTLKSNAIVLAFIALAGTSDVTAVGHAVAGMGLPDKLALLLLFTWRQLHVVAQEYHRLRTAAKVRGFTPGTNLHTYRTYANLAGMVLVRSFDRAERVGQAMRLRGFAGRFHMLAEPAGHPGDRVLSAAIILCAAALLAADILHPFAKLP
ncbi:cobalt ECF transporter T component CbiQ [Nitratidesulfovibrio sp. HK-II]|uniref:cobalt ECF transporter T component CbiQ n=1 Tax=Nitratidesulfovibrio sp. HK-II TaxID=2009266 RepID=UPI000E2E8984|nr:cobalt ECF transporter T component CbiQ [Nitratidesulfovibrio sp. HK-II]GBO96441.1 transmembrane component NikQ of energizing module of nickel ECF transporter [Nitratidesulfovibrio sp. HK-II]